MEDIIGRSREKSRSFCIYLFMGISCTNIYAKAHAQHLNGGEYTHLRTHAISTFILEYPAKKACTGSTYVLLESILQG
jgi:hypothetical protein